MQRGNYWHLLIKPEHTTEIARLKIAATLTKKTSSYANGWPEIESNYLVVDSRVATLLDWYVKVTWLVGNCGKGLCSVCGYPSWKL